VFSVYGWLVFCCGQQSLDEIRKATDDELSIDLAIDDTIQTTFTVGDEFSEDRYHIPIIRKTLTRNLGANFHLIRDEVSQSFQDILSLEGNEWKKIPAMDTILKVVSRTSNRLFVGLPLCRDPDYMELNIQFTVDVMVVASILRMFPKFMRPLVNKWITKVPACRARALKHLTPLIEERLQKEKQYGKDWPGKPNDALTWLIERAEEKRRTPYDLCLRILGINFAAIHTSSITFLQVLYHLAAEPKYVPELRQEVERVVEEDGWTRDALERMVKIDSFIRESTRLNPLSVQVMNRKVIKDFTFSNGTFLPVGSTLAIPLYPVHHNEATYSQPDVFDPFRFSRMKEAAGDDRKMQIINPSPDFLSFGIGKHACPGRFFAANEMKLMLAHILVNYDVKMENEGVRPRSQWIAGNYIPDMKAGVMFRRRAS
jgi:cytochrome P450